ncbi:protein S100-A13-like isoform X2 [Lithobates pipiens]
MTAIPKPTIRLSCLLIFLSLFSAYSTKTDNPCLQSSIQRLVEGFTSIAKREGNTETMNVNELKEYLKLNTPETLKGQDPDFVQRTFQSLDENRDGELEYGELSRFQMEYIVAAYHRKYRPQK